MMNVQFSGLVLIFPVFYFSRVQGMKCLITYTSSTEREDFYGFGADAKVPDLGSRSVTLNDIFGPMKENGLDAEILVEKKDKVLTH